MKDSASRINHTTYKIIMPNNINIVCNPEQKSEGINSEKILSDLGKATKRGVKKCPGCGYLNGTRGYMCKNALCHMIFKDGDKRKQQFDSVKLVTGTSRQIYSVRVKDKGPDSRGFVQLPYYENEEKNLLSEVALCFVDTCQRLFDNSILKCHENESGRTSTICVHIESALKSVAVAVALDFKHDLINSLNVEEDVKKKLCLLAKSTQGPVVQRIARNLMVVKCAVTPTNPLGYLHFILGSSKGSDCPEDIDTFLCGCTENISQVKNPMDVTKCIHYYACVCAFGSDTKLSNKYVQFIQTEFDSLLFPSYEFNLVNMLDTQMSAESVPLLQPDNILEFTENPQNIEIEVLPTEFIFEPDPEIMSILPVKEKSRRKKKDTKVKAKRLLAKKEPELNYFDFLSFNEWLPSVTERINTSMNYSCSVEPLSFHISKRFFELLRDRIYFVTKGHAPDETKSIIRDIPPIGEFVKSSWYLTDKNQLKEIFDTKEVKLMLSRSFVQNSEGIFVEAKDDYLLQSQISKFVSYLIVGEENPACVFVIEWTGDLFTVSKFGELRLVYTVGHKVVKS